MHTLQAPRIISENLRSVGVGMENRIVFTFGEFTTTVNFMDKKEVSETLSGSGLSVFDQNTAKLFPAFQGRSVILPAGETSKEWQSVERILNEGFQAELSRRDSIAGIGGGVVCDMTAFAASLYMRGTGLVLVPTTLLAMVDASLGGKTGINFGGYKNMVGTFYPAARLLISPELLSGLSGHEFKSGLAEVIKTAALGDAELFALLRTKKDDILNREPGVLSELIRRCIMVKGRVVEADLREKGIRAHLNFGHTFAHALESVSGFGRYSHGEAVAWGMGKALDTGCLLGITEPSYADELKGMLRDYGFSLSLDPWPAEKLIDAMRNDKKKNRDGIVFILQRELCDTFTTTVAVEDLKKIL